jgi:hypothetical protein
MLEPLQYLVSSRTSVVVLILAGTFGWLGCAGEASAPLPDAGAGDGAPGDVGNLVDVPPATVSFARDVYPIVETMGCAQVAGCHTDSRSPTAHFSDYRTVEMTYTQWTTGAGFDHCPKGEGPSITAPPPEPRLIPGKPEESLIIRKLTEPRLSCPPFYGRMPPPPFPPLSAEQIQTIRVWVREGARNN